MSLPKALLGLFVITGMSGCMDHIHFYGDGDLADFYKISTFMGEITKVENCFIREMETLEGNDIEGYEGREAFACIEVMTFDEYRMMIRGSLLAREAAEAGEVGAEILAGDIAMTPEGYPIARTQAELEKIENDDSIPIGTLIRWEPDGPDSVQFFKKGE